MDFFFNINLGITVKVGTDNLRYTTDIHQNGSCSIGCNYHKSRKLDSRQFLPEFWGISTYQDRLSGNCDFKFRETGSIVLCQQAGEEASCLFITCTVEPE